LNIFQVKLSYCQAWKALPVVDIARPSKAMFQIRNILILLSCFWCVGAWRWVANILELPVGTIFVAEQYLTQKQDQHDSWNVV
jgi:hypothetical protein